MKWIGNTVLCDKNVKRKVTIIFQFLEKNLQKFYKIL